MKLLFVMTVISLAMVASTPKDNSRPVDDARQVLLKEIVAQTLPNPYFYFRYDSLHYIRQINFAAGFTMYTVDYTARRVSKMTNTTNGNFLLYTYDGEKVAEINEFSGLTQDKIYSYRFCYNTYGQLAQVLWFDFLNDPGGNLFKKSELTYQQDGNLSIIDHFNVAAGQVNWAKTIQFSQYDSKANVDDFDLLGDFFDSFLFLPQVKLQFNNPRRQQMTSPEEDIETLYSYSYQNNLPVQKTGVSRRKGGGEEKPMEITNQFHYY